MTHQHDHDPTFGVRRSQARRSAGFTAIELLVTIAIVAILAAVALPSFKNVISRYEVSSAVEDMTAAIYAARTESIKRQGAVALRKLPNTASCTTLGAQDWSCGWIVFEDKNKNGTQNTGENTLRSYPAPKNVGVSSNPSGTGYAVLKGDAWGKLSGSGALGAFSFGFTPLNDSDADAVRTMCMSSGGRLQVKNNIGVCS